MTKQDLISLKEGNTPLVKIGGIYFKCEFKNPTGSHKDRAFSFEVSRLKEQGIKNAVISSSGNAAISAANYCRLAGITLHIFVSPNINRNKLKVLENLNCSIVKTERPVSDSVKYSKKVGAYNLRQSTDPNAVYGYQNIASEIIKDGISPDAVFMPVSSGTTLVGTARGFKKLGYNVPFHAVQTDTVHPVSGVFDKDFKETGKKSLADAIVAKFTPREDEVVKIIKDTRGSGWVITNSQMEEGRKWLLAHNLNCSYEGAAALAALWKAEKGGYKFKNPVCILTGRYY